MSTESFYIENSIAKQIERIDTKIKELEEEKRALHRLLLKSRQEDILSRDVARKNSINRILVETKIISALKKSQKPLSNSDLYQAAKMAVFNLKENTFRSHIKRLKDAGKIVPRGNHWLLPNSD